MEMSKRIALSVLILYIGSVIFTFVAKVLWDIDVREILDYVQNALMVILVSYFTKAGVENYQKINNSGGDK